MTEIVLTIPCLPDLDLSANRRRSRHYMKQAKDTAIERQRAAVMLMEAKYETGEPWDFLPWPISLSWCLYFPKGVRARDTDSLASLVKSWQDAMIDLQWLPNDSPRYVRRVSYESVPSSNKGPSMTLRIETAGGG